MWAVKLGRFFSVVMIIFLIWFTYKEYKNPETPQLYTMRVASFIAKNEDLHIPIWDIQYVGSSFQSDPMYPEKYKNGNTQNKNGNVVYLYYAADAKKGDKYVRVYCRLYSDKFTPKDPELQGNSNFGYDDSIVTGIVYEGDEPCPYPATAEVEIYNLTAQAEMDNYPDTNHMEVMNPDNLRYVDSVSYNNEDCYHFWVNIPVTVKPDYTYEKISYDSPYNVYIGKETGNFYPVSIGDSIDDAMNTLADAWSDYVS